MLNENGQRMLAYVATIDEIKPIPNYDRVEHARIGGWWVIISKNDNFKVGDKCIYFEIDSKVPSNDERFAFLENRNYKVKTLRMCKVFSQGLVMPIDKFPEMNNAPVGADATEALHITYAVEEDNVRKSDNIDPNAKYMSMRARHKKLFKNKYIQKLMRYSWFRDLMFFFFGKKKDNPKGFPTHFPGVHKTDQERVENMTWILNDKTPFIRTQKCDGSSGTYILERGKKKNKYEFYVCSRNVRMLNSNQECFYGSNNYYWDMAKKYQIEEHMRDWLEAHPDATFVCWQGEICGPGIQKNPHHLKETHFYCFHWTDSINGRRNIIEAEKDWHNYLMEVVPIVDTHYILPDDFEEFKLSADGFYDSDVCEGHTDCPREGYVYYKTTDPSFSFKNVSRKYLLKEN